MIQCSSIKSFFDTLFQHHQVKNGKINKFSSPSCQANTQENVSLFLNAYGECVVTLSVSSPIQWVCPPKLSVSLTQFLCLQEKLWPKKFPCRLATWVILFNLVQTKCVNCEPRFAKLLSLINIPLFTILTLIIFTSKTAIFSLWTASKILNHTTISWQLVLSGYWTLWQLIINS